MPIKDSVRLRHMLESAREAVAFADEKTLGDLEADRMRTLALVRCIEIIGEPPLTLRKSLKRRIPRFLGG